MLLTSSVNSYKTNIDKCWHSQDVYYDYKFHFAITGKVTVLINCAKFFGNRFMGLHSVRG